MEFSFRRKAHFSVTAALTALLGTQQYAERTPRDFYVVRVPGAITAQAGLPSFEAEVSSDPVLGVVKLRASRRDISDIQIPPGFVAEPVIEHRISACAPPNPVPPIPNEPPPAGQNPDWGVDRVHSLDVFPVQDGHSVRVCVIDTGVDLSHPDLKVSEYRNFTGGDPNDVHDFVGHGTHTAGLVAALNNSIGVVGASQAELIVAKVLSDQGSGSQEGIAQGIVWCTDRGARVISASLGSRQGSQMIFNAILYAAQRGVSVWFAAGNDGVGSLSFPAGFNRQIPRSGMSGLFAVSATDQQDNRASFSNYGGEDFACPGVDILSTMPGSRYGKMSGTSMATPICAGLAALYISANKVIRSVGFNKIPDARGINN